MKHKESGEVYPLLTKDWLGTPTYKQVPIARNIRQGDEDIPEADFEDDEEVLDMIDQKKKRWVNLAWIDVFLLVTDFLQIFALIQSMSTRWVYPERWLRNTYYFFLVNLDFWEFFKFHNQSSYISVQNYYLESNRIEVSYKSICYVCYFSVAGLAIIYGVMHLFLRKSFYPLHWARKLMSWVQFWSVHVVHFLTLPVGTILFRLYHCEGEFNMVYTMNEHHCFTLDHWRFAAPAIVYMCLIFLAYPAFLVWKIRQEGMTGTEKGYLAFILMKETEYKIHLNRSWLYDSLWVFSSYKHRGRYYRSVLQMVKLILLIIFAGAFNNIKLQSILTCVWLLIVLIAAGMCRPFRLTSCNVFLIFGLLCNVGNSFLGSLISAYTTYEIPSAWLTAGYTIWFLMFIQACWGASLVVFLIYLMSRTLCHSAKCCYKRPVWPNIASSGDGRLTTETRKFMAAIIKAKIAMEKMERMPMMFAPVHELARHIHIINTYCREAEYIQDALHLVLWEVLDDLVELHAKISPSSLFAESVKKSIRRTAAEFMKLVPMFTQRLAQRDYDLILVPPHKRRLLLKMYILGLFLNGRSERMAKRKLLEPATEKVWPKLSEEREFIEEDGYYEDLFPAPSKEMYGDDLLDVVVDGATDEESSEEEDNVQLMLRNLPEIGLIDLEMPTLEDTEEDESEDNVSPAPWKPEVTFGHVTTSDRNTPRPISAKSSSLSSSSSSSNSKTGPPNRPGSTSSSLFGSHVSLRKSDGSTLSVREAAHSPTRSLSPVSQSPVPAGQRSPVGPRSRSPSGRPASGSTVVSSQPSRPGSADTLDDNMAAINPGYVPDSEYDTVTQQGANNHTVIDDDVESNVSMVTEPKEEKKKIKHTKNKKK